MRFGGALILIWLVVPAGLYAQSAAGFDSYSNSEAVQRWDSQTKRAIAAINANAAGKPGKKDPLLVNQYEGKKFEGNAGVDLAKKTSPQNTFLYDEKVSAGKFSGMRSFFGIKNLWFGRKVFPANKAGLWSKSIVENADRKFPVDAAEAKKALMAEKTVKTSDEIVETRPFIAKGGAQGAMDVETAKIKKDMSIEDVRKLLNKN
jgi:hypothetical protein